VRYTASLSTDERAIHVPFCHELIGLAFDTIRPLFMVGTAVDTKSDATPVTAADRGAELAMRRHIETRFPGHGVYGEEFGIRDAVGALPRYRWVLDPVDGTKAFISNCFLFGTLIALERDDGAGYRPVLGVIAHAAAGMAVIGSADGCTLYTGDGGQRPARVRPCTDLATATLLTTDHLHATDRLGERFEALAREVRLYRTWGDCFGYFAIATGAADAMVDPVLSYYDIAAIVPVIEGAGGTVTSITGGDPLQDLTLLVTAGPLHATLLERLR
jgi:myo-inositol-1(or 4)-monophosphatase